MKCPFCPFYRQLAKSMSGRSSNRRGSYVSQRTNLTKMMNEVLSLPPTQECQYPTDSAATHLKRPRPTSTNVTRPKLSSLCLSVLFPSPSHATVLPRWRQAVRLHFTCAVGACSSSSPTACRRAFVMICLPNLISPLPFFYF